MGRSRLSQNGEGIWPVLAECIVKMKRERVLLLLEGDPEKEKSGREDGKRIPRGGVRGEGSSFFGKRNLEPGVLVRRPWGEREGIPLNK